MTFFGGQKEEMFSVEKKNKKKTKNVMCERTTFNIVISNRRVREFRKHDRFLFCFRVSQYKT